MVSINPAHDFIRRFHMPKCQCGAQMYQHVMFSGIGTAALNRYSCPLNRWWNFWKHPDVSL